MTRMQASQLTVGNVVLPPEREIRLWMKRALAERNLPESALHLTITSIDEGAPDKKGRWLRFTCQQAPEWFQQTKPYPFVFKARPETPWAVVA